MVHNGNTLYHITAGKQYWKQIYIFIYKYSNEEKGLEPLNLIAVKTL